MLLLTHFTFVRYKHPHLTLSFGLFYKAVKLGKNEVLRRQEVTRLWRNCTVKSFTISTLHQVIKSKKGKMGGACSRVVHMEEVGSGCKILVRKPKGRYHLAHVEVNRWTIFKWNSKELEYESGSMAGSCEHMNKPSGSI